MLLTTKPDVSSIIDIHSWKKTDFTMFSFIWNFFAQLYYKRQLENLQNILSDLDLNYNLATLLVDDNDTVRQSYIPNEASLTLTTNDNKTCDKTVATTEEDDWIVRDEQTESPENALRLEAEGKAMHKILVGFVNSVYLREITIQPSGITVKLDEINCNFVPMMGDIVELKTICMADPFSSDLAGKVISVDYLNPLRSRTVFGRVIKWQFSDDGQSGSGEIMPASNDEKWFDEKVNVAFFALSNCEPGYSPCVGDFVCADCIESHQGDLKWRALTVATLNTINIKKHNRDPEELELLNSLEYIKISSQTHLGRMQFGTSKKLKVVITNEGQHITTLKAIYPHPRLCCPKPQFFLENSSCIPVQLVIQSHCIINFTCFAKHLGSSQEFFVFEFENGQRRGCYLQVQVVANINDTESSSFSKFHKRLPHDWKSQYNAVGHVINAPRRLGRLDPFRRRLPQFPLIEKAKKLAKQTLLTKGKVATYQTILEYFPDFRIELNATNYKKRWHDLLFIEEAENIADMQKFDIQGAQLLPAGKAGPDDLYALEIPGLSENRPSLISSDTLQVQHINGGVVFEGIVHRVMLTQILLRFHERFQAPGPDDTYFIIFVLKRNSYRRLHAAVDAAWSNLNAELLFPSTKLNLRNPQVLIEDYVTPEERLTFNRSCETSKERYFNRTSPNPAYRGRSCNKRDLERDSWSYGNRMSSKQQTHVPYIKKMMFINTRLNPSQRAAVRNILLGRGRPLPYIIYGPPGTGKTITVVETILQIYLHLKDSRILVATPSNSAADLITERLLDSGKLMPGALVRLVAVSYEENLTPRLIPYSRVLKGIGELKSRDQDLVFERIVIGTCATLGRLVQNSSTSANHFTHVLVDEAGQTMEPETMLVTALLGRPLQIVLAGDPMQLGPVVVGNAAELAGLGVSLLKRLLNQGPYLRDTNSFPKTQGYNPDLITMLVQNYRSIPEILALPGALFYNSELVATVSQHQGVEASLLATMSDELPLRPNEGPPGLVFHGVRGICKREFDSPSWYNDVELYQAVTYISALYKRNVEPSQIGIISPYTKQVQKMRSLLFKMNLGVPKVGSVEEFQGQERLVIIFSAVRSAETCGEEALGFLSNPNRMNTAITRARALMVVLGDPHLLALNPTWRSLILDCIKRNAYCGCDMPSSLLTVSPSVNEV